MINFKFVKAQFKSVIIPIIILFILFVVLLIPALILNSFAPGITIDKSGSGGPESSGELGGAILLPSTLYGIPGFILMFAFGIVLIHILLVKETDRGYLASWLTTPMTRRTILNSKLFVILSSIMMVNIVMLILQLIFFAALYRDFHHQAQVDIVLASFSFLFLSFLWTAINWVIMGFFNKPGAALSVAIGVSTWFIICAILSQMSGIDAQFKFLKYFKYFTITSFFNLPFNFGDLPDVHDPSIPAGFHGTIYAEVKPIHALDFAWQMPVMIIVGAGGYYGGNLIVIHKDLAL
ncbi:ABC transporter permease [Spiroplasma sp. DGKH1]|uniref:ABC transporter permease n=1 Tax=Spiroplasma sp. DGKH1 TaxID=3050074 RepID=UPI0034C628BC